MRNLTQRMERLARVAGGDNCGDAPVLAPLNNAHGIKSSRRFQPSELSRRRCTHQLHHT